MSKLTPTKRSLSCPICGDTKGKCRNITDDRGSLILCMSYAGTRVGEIIDGYRCLGDTRDGTWAKFIPDNTQTWTEEQRFQWRQERQRIRRQREQEEAQRKAQALSAEQRDCQYRQLLSELSLNEQDKLDLIRRGFTHQEISQCGFKSVNQWQKLQAKYSHLLPGINLTGDALITQPGYLIPVRNADGLIVALQIRLRVINSDSSRYRWLSSRNQKRPNGSKPHLYPEGCQIEGELPLAIHRPPGKPTGIALAEGTGAKPFLVSQRLNQIVIGASGGQWTSSEITFKDSLNKLKAELEETKEIIIYPDAGDIINYSVINRWRRVISLLRKWGWSVKIAWWNQITKEVGDIDEIQDYSQIQYISTSKFFRLSKNQRQNTQTPEVSSKLSKVSSQSSDVSSQQSKPQLSEGSAKLSEFSSKPSRISSKRSKISAKLSEHPSKPSKPSSTKPSKLQDKKSARSSSSTFTQTNDLAWSHWRQSRLFTPHITFDAKHFHAELPQPETLLAIRSGLGTGKTHWLVEFLLEKLSDMGFVSIGYRNSILLQFCAIAKSWYHLQQDLKGREEEILLRDPASKIACCIDSLTYFTPENFDGKVLILDETESIVSHLLQANTAVSYYREKIKGLFVEALNRASIIICLDGHLTDGTISYLEKLITRPNQVIKIHNLYKGNRGIVEFYEGVQSSDGVKVNDYSHIFSAISNNSNCFAIGSDSQQKIEALDKILISQGRKTLRYDSTTSKQKWVNEFLNNPPDYLLKHQIEAFLYSPSAEAGLNIDIKGYFSDIYFIFVGVLSTNPQLQMIGRIRDSEAKIHIFCSQIGLPIKAVSSSPIPERLQQEIFTYVLDCASASLTGISQDDLIFKLAGNLIEFSADKHFDHETKLIALENHERANLRDCLREALIHSGYKVEITTGQKFDVKPLQDERHQVQLQRSIAIHSSADVTTQEAEKKTRDFGATLEDKYQVTKRRLLDRLPGIEKATYTVTVPVTEVTNKSEENTAAISLDQSSNTPSTEENQPSPNMSPAAESINNDSNSLSAQTINSTRDNQVSPNICQPGESTDCGSNGLSSQRINSTGNNQISPNISTWGDITNNGSNGLSPQLIDSTGANLPVTNVSTNPEFTDSDIIFLSPMDLTGANLPVTNISPPAKFTDSDSKGLSSPTINSTGDNQIYSNILPTGESNNNDSNGLPAQLTDSTGANQISTNIHSSIEPDNNGSNFRPSLTTNSNLENQQFTKILPTGNTTDNNSNAFSHNQTNSTVENELSTKTSPPVESSGENQISTNISPTGETTDNSNHALPLQGDSASSSPLGTNEKQDSSANFLEDSQLGKGNPNNFSTIPGTPDNIEKPLTGNIEEPITSEPALEQLLPVQYCQVEKPVFSPEFIKKVLFEDKTLISKIETYWLLMHPEVAKLLQQERWHKKLCIFTDPEKPDCSKKMNLTAYQSRWLKIFRLVEMGIMYFLEPGVTWSADSPEAIDFWHKGKLPQYRRAIKIKVGKSKPCDYIGKVLSSLNVKTKSDLVRTDGKRVRVYQVDAAALNSPIRKAIYEAVGRRFEEHLASEKVILDWESVSSAVKEAQNQTGLGVEGGSPSTNLFIKNSEGDRLSAIAQPIAQPGDAPNSQQLLSNTQQQAQTQSLQDVECGSPSTDLFIKNQEGDRLMPIAQPGDAPNSQAGLSNTQQQAQTQPLQGVEGGSPCGDLFIKNQEGDRHKIQWLMQLLADLEATPAPHPRFESNEQLIALFNQAEELGIQCSQQLLSSCPQYWERFVKGIGELCQLLPEKAIPDDTVEELDGYAFRLIAALEYGVDDVKGILKLWSIEQRKKVVLAMQEWASDAVNWLAQLIPDWLSWQPL